MRHLSIVIALVLSLELGQASVAPALNVGSIRGFSDREAELSLILARATNTTAFQFDLSFNPLNADRLPPVWSELLSNHVVRTHEIKPGLWRTLIYSPSNSLLRPNLTVATLPFHIPATERNGSGPVSPSKFILSQPDATSVVPVSTRSGRIFVTQVSPPDLDGSVSLFFPVTQGGDYVLFASDDFTQWSAVDTNTAAGNIVDFIDRDAPRFPHRFYFMSQPTVTLSATAGVGSGGSGVEGAQALSLRVPGPGVYAVEASADLKTWSVVGEVTSQTGKIEMPVSHLHEPKQRFFRLRPR